MANNSKKCFCAFCKHERRINTKRHITFNNVFLSLLSTVLLMFVFWQNIDPRAIILFVVSLCIAEAFIIIRWRVTLSCPYCGFDPILYKRSPEKMVQKVTRIMSEQRGCSDFWLRTKNPTARLAKRPALSIKDELAKNLKEISRAQIDAQSAKEIPATRGR